MKDKPLKSNHRPARKRPLPVGLTEGQHEYLESKGNKAEYMRNLLIIDMEKNK